MKSFALLILSLTMAIAVRGQAYSVESVPNVHLADARQYVADPKGILSAAARDTINALFAALERQTGIETAVAVLPSIGEADAFDFGHKLFRHWGIGKKSSNNGLLILFVEDQRTIRFVTGYGLEGFLTDAKCKRIQTQQMLPAFRQGDYSAGMVSGAKAVCATLSGTMEPEAETEEGVNPLWNFLFLVAAVLFILFLMGALNGQDKRCPYCRKKALRKMSTDYYRDQYNRRMRKDIYICGACGKVTVKDTPVDNDNRGSGLGSFLTGMFIGSLFSGRGRGGFSGGSFGGGDSGGGGSGSNW